MEMDNPGCEFYDYEPNEHRRCWLLGYRISCGSEKCKKARAEYEAKEGAKKDTKK